MADQVAEFAFAIGANAHFMRCIDAIAPAKAAGRRMPTPCGAFGSTITRPATAAREKRAAFQCQR